MAKKSTGRTSTNNRRTRSPRTSSGRTQARDLSTAGEFESDQDDQFEAGGRDYKEIITELISNPAVKYVAGGIATALLTRLANNMATRYPEISSFIKENLDDLEGKISNFSRDLKGDSARH